MVMTQRGRIRLMLTVQEQEESDSFSEKEAGWKDLFKRWFQINPLQGREYEQAQQTKAVTTHLGRCHWFEGANSKMRLTDGTRVWNVSSVVNEQERNRFLEWRLVEVV